MKIWCFLLFILFTTSLIAQQDTTYWESIDSTHLADAWVGAEVYSDITSKLIPEMTKRLQTGPLTVSLANNYHKTSLYLRFDGQSDLARAYNDTAIDLRIRAGALTSDIAQSYYEKGVIHHTLGIFPLAVEYHERAIELMEQAIQEEGLTDDLANRYGYLLQRSALSAIFTGNYELARLRLSQVPAMLAVVPNSTTENDALRNEADMAIYDDDLPKAIALYEQIINKELSSDKRPEQLSVLYMNLSLALMEDGQYGQAENQAFKAIDLYTNEITNLGDQLAGLYSNLLQNDILQSRFDRDREFLRLGTAAGNEYYATGKGPVLGELYLRAATIASIQRNHPRADSLFQASTTALTEDDQLLGPAQLPRIEGNTIYGQEDLLELLAARRDAYVRAFDAGDQEDGLELALHASASIDTLLRINRDQLSLTASLGQFINQEAGHYQKGIDLALRLHRMTGEDRYVRQAYQIVSGQKSNLLRRYLSSPGLAISLGVPEEVVDRKSELEITILQAERSLQVAEETERSALRDTLLSRNNRLIALRRELTENYPAFSRALRGYDAVNIDAAIASLDADQLLIEYQLAEDSLYVFTMSAAAGLQYYVLPAPEKLEEEITAIIDGGADNDTLYNSLLAPFLDGRQGISRIQIIPDGDLWRLPFAAIRHNGNFLVREYAISYAYAAPLLFDETIFQRANASQERYLGYGISYEEILQRLSGNGNRSATDQALRDMGQLPFASQEVSEAAKIINGSYRLNAEATKERFLAEGNSAKILHLSMHGLLKPNPMQSALVFQGGEDSDYSLLTMREVLSSTFSAALTVLSACHTGGGPIQTSEGMQSIGRAFTAAGSRATLTSAWEAGDESTHDILIAFFDRLAQGESKDIALQAAMIDYLDQGTPAQRQPLNWAHLAMTGKLSPVGKSYGWLPWALAGGLLFVLAGWWWRSRKV